jgi:hypothetical protein
MNAARVQFETSSNLPAPSKEVWKRISTAEGVNYELFPFLRMTIPKEWHGMTLADLPIGRSVGRSWFLLFGSQQSSKAADPEGGTAGRSGLSHTKLIYRIALFIVCPIPDLENNRGWKPRTVLPFERAIAFA